MAEKREPGLLSSGNPQIPKGEGDAPVKAWIDAAPGWKSAIGRRLDRIVDEVFPEVRKAVKWNTPLYGKKDGWFFSMYCYRNHVQLTFMQGTSLTPPPPTASKVEGVRYLNIHEEDTLDETQIAAWLEQAIRAPGVKL
ncbi:MAG: DUF1801 domain-containing protein [Paracoccaceae bacterium]